ncbi:MAG: SRPBCC family protein [Proteobacteria bacterium]|nr:SRPBCC family protein [Pseudomonadota bacterium]
MVRHIVGGLLVVIVALVGGAYLLPRGIHVERTTEIARPAAAVFPYVNSLKRANEWSPWMALDPAVKVSYSGPDEGVGARMTWAGNDKVGTGSQEIVQSVAGRKVASDLQFGSQGPAKAALLLTTTEHGTQVVWSLDIDLGNNPVARYVGLTLDKQIGADYERGLAKLKALIESQPAAEPQPASAPATAANAPTS